MAIVEKVVHGKELAPYIDLLGRLRLSVFKEWPYLYDGDLNYERSYLQTYVSSPSSMAVLLFDNDHLIGATTAILLKDETSEFQKPFLEKKIPTEQVVYFGESLLQKNYRGRGYGKYFMEKRLHFARSFSQVQWAAFCSVTRNEEHPQKPHEYRALNPFWQTYGFELQSDMIASYEWKDVGDEKSTFKQLQFWLKPVR